MKVIIVSGGFDPIHSGHIAYFNSAKELGDKLVVALNSDGWLINKKGNFFMPFDERKAIIENLSSVDSVINFDDDEKGTATNALIKVKEIYTHKCRAGWLQKYKYRHAARGDMLDVDQHGVTYWSSASSTALKIFCAIAAGTGCEPQVLDVNTAYLNAPELHEIYMEIHKNTIFV